MLLTCQAFFEIFSQKNFEPNNETDLLCEKYPFEKLLDKTIPLLIKWEKGIIHDIHLRSSRQIETI